MANKNTWYLISVSWELEQNIPAPVPSGFVWTKADNFYMKKRSFPTWLEIFQKALENGASKKGFRITAVSPVPNNFKNFPPDPFTDTKEEFEEPIKV